MTSPEAETSGAPAAKRRVYKRAPKLDAVLAEAVERARQGVLEIAPAEQVGAHISAVAEAERMVIHRFEANVPGYGGWQWFASLARVPRSKHVTVCEVGLLPSETSLLAPDWVPWAERVRPEEAAAAEAEAAESAGPEATEGSEAGRDEAEATESAGSGEAAQSGADAEAGPTEDEAPAEDVPGAAGLTGPAETEPEDGENAEASSAVVIGEDTEAQG
ncbi:hypothetical protein D477_007534 [Arthrobacter crystallopoietes BAB-32]|uniref:DUF3027 domain-containing protein n=1 Tax=Arthrobacter crystallopoietes BAB-32 TaxID=1246476 RepID=N1V4A1_9MICC|nr:DUF3027 domain-containing protein [Arthrobacter crystallopoietes]EMY34819.1 hypothetical protein D477_007534 [Arthrobacter crystallopoietes BAB-32]